MTLHEIEDLIKSVNRNAIKAMLRNAAILNDPNVTDEMRAQAMENVKAIAANKPTNEIQNIKMKPPGAETPKPKKVKSAAASPEEAIKLAQQTVMPQPTAPTVAPTQFEYPEDLHLSPLNSGGHDAPTMKGIFDALPDHEKKNVIDWHTSNKMKKSVDLLHDLFTQLKKHI